MKTDKQIVIQVNRIKDTLMARVLSEQFSSIQTKRFANFCEKYRNIKYKLEQKYYV